MGAPTLLIGLLLVAGAARAVTIESMHPSTRSGTVAWETDVTMEVSSLVVEANRLVIDGVGYDVQPASGSVTVTITHWSADQRAFTIARDPAAAATVTVNNPGRVIVPYLGAVALAVCQATTATCSWSITSATSSNVRLYFDPTGEIVEEEGNASQPDAPLPISAGGGGGSSRAPAVENLPYPLPPLPNPVALFPTFQWYQWATFVVGFILVVSSFPRSRKRISANIRPPLRPAASLFLGVVVLTLLYLTAGSV